MIDDKIALTELEKALKAILAKTGNTAMVNTPLDAAILVFSFEGYAGLVTASTTPVEAIMNMTAVTCQLIASIPSYEDRAAIALSIAEALRSSMMKDSMDAETVTLTPQPLKS